MNKSNKKALSPLIKLISISLTLILLTGCGSKSSDDFDTAKNIEIGITIEKISSASVKDQRYASRLSLSMVLSEEDFTNTLYIEDNETFELQIDSSIYNLHDYRVDSPNTIVSGKETRYELELNTKDYSEREAKVSLTIQGKTYLLEFVIPEQLDVSIIESELVNYNPATDDINLAWTSGLPIDEIRLSSKLLLGVQAEKYQSTTGTECPPNRGYNRLYLAQPAPEEQSHQIKAGSASYLCRDSDSASLNLTQEKMIIEPKAQSGFQAHINFSQHYGFHLDAGEIETAQVKIYMHKGIQCQSPRWSFEQSLAILDDFDIVSNEAECGVIIPDEKPPCGSGTAAIFVHTVDRLEFIKSENGNYTGLYDLSGNKLNYEKRTCSSELE